MGDELLWAVKNGDLDAVEKCLKKVRRPQTHGGSLATPVALDMARRLWVWFSTFFAVEIFT